MTGNTPYGFRIKGDCHNDRRLIDVAAAFAAYAGCDEKANVQSEAYLSAFQFGSEFRQHLEMTRSTKDYAGLCCAAWHWFDIDREDDLEDATTDARRLSCFLLERYSLDDDALLLFYSGSKGYHVGLPTALWKPESSNEYHRIARQFAERLAELASVEIDTGVYDKVRAFRAPNSRHPKTGLYKRRLSCEELLGLKLEAIQRMAAEPEPFELPTLPARNQHAVDDWQAAIEQVAKQAESRRQHKAEGTVRLTNETRHFICEGAENGDRHRALFRAAANLAELDCPRALAHELLTESGLDCGLKPSDVKRQIDCGLDWQKPEEAQS
jgi:hypothetical protein